MIKSQKTTFLVDTVNRIILCVHLTTGRKHDTRIAPILVGRGLKNFLIKLLTGDKGYDDEKFRMLLRNNRIIPVIKYRIFDPAYSYINDVVDMLGYSQRVHNETVNSIIKRKYGDKLRSRKWFTQFKETKFKVIVYNIERNLFVFFIRTVFISDFL